MTEIVNVNNIAIDPRNPEKSCCGKFISVSVVELLSYKTEIIRIKNKTNANISPIRALLLILYFIISLLTN